MSKKFYAIALVFFMGFFLGYPSFDMASARRAPTTARSKYPPNYSAWVKSQRDKKNSQGVPRSLLAQQSPEVVSVPSPSSTTFLLTDFGNHRVDGWTDEQYGTTIHSQSGKTFCRLSRDTSNRCGVATSIREIDYGLGVKRFQGIRVSVINLSKQDITFEPRFRASWYESQTSNALIMGTPAVLSAGPVNLGVVQSGKEQAFFVSWNAMRFEGFDPQQDFLAGISIEAVEKGDIGIEKIELYTWQGGVPERIKTTHSGGFMVYQRKSDASRFTYSTFTGTNWGEPFSNQHLSPGDIIEVYGVVNAGTVMGFFDGTAAQPIILKGMTPDAAFDGKAAVKLGQNGGLITLYGNYWVIKDLTLRNCGSGYRGDANASAFYATTSHTVFSNLKVYNCGNGFFFSSTSKNNIIENSDIFNNGYFHSGSTHNVSLDGEGNIARNNRIHHSGGQNLKIRGWNSLIEANLILNAGNFDIDFSGSEKKPEGTTSIFRGNTVVKSHYSDNPAAFFTFFEDNFDFNLADRLMVVNNTFVGPAQAFVFRIGKNKILEAYNNVVVGMKNIQYQGNTDHETGFLVGSNNWLPQDARFLGGLTDSFSGRDPGLIPVEQYWVLDAFSPLKNIGTNTPTFLPKLIYAWPSPAVGRYQDGHIDLGAFEFFKP